MSLRMSGEYCCASAISFSEIATDGVLVGNGVGVSATVGVADRAFGVTAGEASNCESGSVCGKLGIGRDSVGSSGESSGSGVTVSPAGGLTAFSGARIIRGAVRPRGPGLIGRTGSKYCGSGVSAGIGSKLSVEIVAAGDGDGVSP